MYEYQAKDGEVIEEHFPSTDFPKRIRRKGKTFAKRVSLPEVRREFSPYSSYALATRMEGFKHDSEGNCVIESRAQEKQVAKDLGMEWR